MNGVTPEPRLTTFDKFVLGNFVLWSAVILFGYRWRHLEFYMYVLLVLLQAAGMLAAWAVARRFRLPVWALAGLQVAILLHLAGGSIFVHGVRLYDCNLVNGIALPTWFSQLFRYDKLVHGYFAAYGVASLRHVWPEMNSGSRPGPFTLLIVGLMVMGICSIVEILEYVGTKLVSLPDVGGYDNNLQDLLANLVGVLGAGTAIGLRERLRARGWSHGHRRTA
ncbi:MAG TPA: hypothetical protein VGK74_28000 [Symbiobacteriaceae bacterium]